MALEKGLKTTLNPQAEGEEQSTLPKPEVQPAAPQAQMENPAPVAPQPQRVIPIPAEEPPVNRGAPTQAPATEECKQSIASLERSMKDVSTQMSSVVVPAVQRIERGLSVQTPADSGNVEQRLAALEKAIADMEQKQEQNGKYLVQDLRENAAFRIQVRQGMQHDIDELKKINSGTIFEPLLKELAVIYGDWHILYANDLTPQQTKVVNRLMEQMEDLLEEYGCEVVRSAVGAPRRTRVSKVVEKVMTPYEYKHNTVAKSYRPGVIKGNVILSAEPVDVFCYDPNMPLPQEEREAPAEEVPVEEAPAETAETPCEQTTQQTDLPDTQADPEAPRMSEMLPHKLEESYI